MKRILQVCIGDVGTVIGTLWFTTDAGREHSSFQYAQSWIDHPMGFAIAPSLTLDDTKKFFHKGTDETPLPPPIADTTPDSWGREIVIKDAKQKKLDAFSEIDFLTASDDFSRIGALRFRNAEGMPFLASKANGGHAIPPLLHLEQLRMDISRMEDGDPTALALTRLREAGGSLGGSRPKCSILDADGRLSIAKFTSKRDTHAVERAEVLTLGLAHLCGITVPKSRIEMSGNSPVAIIERFDRTTNQKRIPFISAQTMLNASKATGGTYTDLADAIRLHAASVATDLTDLFRRVAFSILVSNTDDHLKNHGFLYSGKGKWRMAPAYDVNPSPHRQKTLKTAIADPQDPSASITLLLDHAFYFEVSKDDAVLIVSSMAKVIASGWKRLAKEAGMTSVEINSYESAFAHEESRTASALGAASATTTKAESKSMEHAFHNGLLPPLPDDDVTGTVRALVKDANMNAFALVTAGTERFAVPISDADRDRLALGETATFQKVDASLYCMVAPATTTDVGEASEPSPSGTKSRVPGF